MGFGETRDAEARAACGAPGKEEKSRSLAALGMTVFLFLFIGDSRFWKLQT